MKKILKASHLNILAILSLSTTLFASDLQVLNEKNVTNSKDSIKSIFPSDKPITENKKHQNALSKIEEKLSTSLSSVNQLREAQKHCAETIFHSLNDCLSFLLSHKKIVNNLIKKNPSLIHFSFVGCIKEEGVFLPLRDFNHPVADLAQTFRGMNEIQYYIDLIRLYKKSIFPDNFSSSYKHNIAVIIKPFIEKNKKKLNKKLNTLNVYILENTNTEENFILNSGATFFLPLLSAFESIIEVLPNKTYSEIHIKNNSDLTSLKKIVTDKIQKDSENIDKEEEKIKDQIHQMGYYSNLDELLALIKNIAFAESIKLQDESLLDSPSFIEYKFFLTNPQIPSFKDLFEGLKNNLNKLHKFKKRIHLSGEPFDGRNIDKKLQNALEKHEQSLRIKDNIPPLEIVEIEEIPTISTESTLKEEKVDNNTLSVTSTDSDAPTTAIDSVLKPPADDYVYENMTFDDEYFRHIHQYHQNKKKNEQKSNETLTLTNYEKKLFTYLLEKIYHPKHRSTWDEIINSLSQFGFEGNPNSVGNGSTWVFTVNQKNELLFNNDDFKYARFNVHMYKGNDPIPPAYLKFFQSGFSNVFGLTEHYLSQSITHYNNQHNAQTI